MSAGASIINLFNDPRLSWRFCPSDWEVEDENGDIEGSGGSYSMSLDGKELKIKPAAKKDFWSKTFYTPLLVKSDACGLLCQVSADIEATIKVIFSYTPVSQFDQAGLLVYIDDEHWVKCGIEFCDGSARLSVVVCNEFSDWSTQPWKSNSVKLKVHKVLQSSSIVVEAASVDSSDFQFVRIAHLSPIGADWRVGPFAASPIAQKGCEATFWDFSVGPKESSEHSSEL